MENPLYSEIKPHRIPDQIVRQVIALIKDNKLHPGEKLPPERNLAQLLGVGRSSLREAINTLETLGFVEIRKRKGIYVRTVSSSMMPDPLLAILTEDESKLHDLYELRKDIELAAAYKAAQLRTATELAKIGRYLKAMQTDSEASSLSLNDDLGFHMAIAEAAHNFLRVHIFKNIFDLYGHYIDLARHKLNQERANIATAVAQHTRIYDAVAQQDAKAARAAMDVHLTWVETQWEQTGTLIV